MDKLIQDLNKKWGVNSVFRFTEDYVQKVETITSGSEELDKALGIGGYPLGRVIEIYGKEGSGKTTLALYAIKGFQEKGYKTAYIDAENSLNLEYARKLGVKVEDMLFTQPETGEDALGILEDFIKSKEVNLVVVDSVAALTPKAIIEGEMGDQTIALLARLMSKALGKLVGFMNRNKVTVIFINQVRMNVGGFVPAYETTPGGKALRFYSTIRLQVTNSNVAFQKDKEKAGHKLKIVVKKNKLAPPFREAEIKLEWGKGFISEKDTD